MPREVITIQIGQCGNQMGLKWWDLILQEYKDNPDHPESLSSLFYEDDIQAGKRGAGGSSGNGFFGSHLRIKQQQEVEQDVYGNEQQKSDTTYMVKERKKAFAAAVDSAVKGGKIKARCVPIDMEEGVLTSMIKGPLGNLFDTSHFVSDVSGAGNNWAVGHLEYGDKYCDDISESVRLLVEKCDSLQTFVFMHSLSGGTGSGLGTRVLSLLEDEYPNVFRFSTVVIPSEVSDVVTAPYNTCFSIRELIEHSDVVLPVDNDALATMAERSLAGGRKGGLSSVCQMTGGSSEGIGRSQVRGGNGNYKVAQPTSNTSLPYDTMNAIIAQMLSNITCSIRYPGQLNMDINEITTNLVPYPRLHFLQSAISPLFSTKQSHTGTRQSDAMFMHCLESDHHLVHGDTKRSTYLAAALIARGPTVNIADVSKNICRMRQQMKMIHWNESGFKSAICSVPPVGHSQSMVMLSNNCAITSKLSAMRDSFDKLYRVRSHVHHYQEYLELSYFQDTLDIISTVIDDYDYLNTVKPPKKKPQSIQDLLV
eukprot:Tbor_TRINITY_DN4378_c0_g2::TRINITY_DN4378_c0_g2_i1::g.7749::m.7749/K10391/TUBE; tubulin epsilon